MSNKSPPKFMAPDEPTAVYPIGSLQVPPPEEPLPEPTPEPVATPAPAFDENFGPPDEATASGGGGLNPVLLTVGFLGGGMVLACFVLLVIGLGLYLI